MMKPLLTKLINAVAFGTEARMTFYQKVGLLLSNGVSLEATLSDALKVARTGSGAKGFNPYAKILERILHDVRSGKGLAEALVPFVSPQEASIIDAGEASGALREAFARVERTLREQAALRSVVWKELAVPLIGIAGVFIAYFIVGQAVAPILLKFMPADAWQGATADLLERGIFVRANAPFIVAAVAAVVLLFRAMMPRLTGRIRNVLDRYPPFNIYRIFAGYTFLMNIAAKLAQGIALEDSLIREKQNATPYLRERIDHTLRGIRSGLNLGDALDAAEHNFPDTQSIGDLRLISGRKGFDQALESYTLDRVAASGRDIKRAASLVRIVVMVFVAFALVGFANGVLDIQTNAQAAFGHHP